jgi:hypothetical protein
VKRRLARLRWWMVRIRGVPIRHHEIVGLTDRRDGCLLAFLARPLMSALVRSEPNRAA